MCGGKGARHIQDAAIGMRNANASGMQVQLVLDAARQMPSSRC